MGSVLIIDDDQELCSLLVDFFSLEGFQVDTSNAPVEGIELALSGRHDIVVLDVMMPKLNGFEVLRRIRSNSQVPVLMLTACGDDVDRIMGLETGADDYLQKPFNPKELVARIRAILRRTTPPTAGQSDNLRPDTMVIDDVEIVSSSRTAYQSGKLLVLTSVEFSILEMMFRNAGSVLSREELVRAVLGRELTAYDRSIDVHVSNLRKKLGTKIDGTDRIKTLRGLGYLYAA